MQPVKVFQPMSRFGATNTGAGFLILVDRFKHHCRLDAIASYKTLTAG